MTNETRFMYKSTIKEIYGLTDKMMEAIGEPDKQVRNPHYSSGPPASLYIVERVEAWMEENQVWIERVAQQREKRQRAATGAALRKRQETLGWARTVPIEIAELPSRKELKRRTWERSMDWATSRRKDDYTPVVDDHAIIAYIRHNLTNYEYLLSLLKGKVGCAEAYMVIKNRTNAEIGERV